MSTCAKTISCLAILILFSSISFTAQANEEETSLFMADGQLKSHPIRIFITKDITEDMHPQLILPGNHSITEEKQSEKIPTKPMYFARNQQSEQVINGSKVTLTGTLLLFDIANYDIDWFKAVTRVTPTLTWEIVDSTGKKVRHFAIGNREVYLGNPIPGFLWPFFLTFALVFFIVILCKIGNAKVIDLFCDYDRHLSLSSTQIACWTITIGGVVAGFGFMRLEVPQIPASLVALMGLSLATGGISYLHSNKVKQGDLPDLHAHKPNFSDLLKDFSKNKEGDLSLARAQMVFWTGLTLILFVVKSVLDVHLWEVPWEMVALMGLSQASYLAPKIAAKSQ